jgi:NADH:ubiquinone oxidoreductase subunit F (NADH-binding)
VPEKRILLKYCEELDPQDIVAYEGHEGFKALKKAQKEMSPVDVIEEVKASGLLGRGGAGFPCGVKWELASKSHDGERYLICNADEGEVGTFKDRYIIQNNPFKLIEGMAIAAYAIGTKNVYIYLREEYHYLLGVLQNAVEKTREKGYLDGVEIEIREGAGSYICGEESALMNSLEGKRGEVRFRPPFPPTSGLFQKPTVINNVETLVNVPHIISRGAKWYQEMGTEKSKGTKIFAVSGDVERPGVYEMEMGCELKELVVDLAGADGIKMVQVGGSTGGIVPSSMLTTPLSYETVLGSGAVVVFDESRDVIDFLYRTMEFLNEESCGKCTPCREGSEVMVEILGRMVKGEGVQEDIQLLEDLSNAMMFSSLCGLGQTAAVPVLDTLKYFRNEYEMRINQSVFLRTLMPKTTG